MGKNSFPDSIVLLSLKEKVAWGNERNLFSCQGSARDPHVECEWRDDTKALSQMCPSFLWCFGRDKLQGPWIQRLTRVGVLGLVSHWILKGDYSGSYGYLHIIFQSWESRGTAEDTVAQKHMLMRTDQWGPEMQTGWGGNGKAGDGS